MISEADRKTLLGLARQSISHHLNRRALPEPDVAGILKERRGAFVTLKKHGDLRGCIGIIDARLPLWETVAEMAVSAAVHDTRFPPVTANELPALSIEISVLSPFRRVADIAEIVVGRDGLMIRRGMRSGLLLPQVATEYGWDREEFLRHTSLKAGLDPDAWKGDVELSAFSAEIFHEPDGDARP
ncbi:MAG: hypothetical protein A2Z34_11665 [Planctomycetes bacterium RBG_16_59_8]|nr:MAG: hypothetical protein A2Z34_11665 [Planctomycetes bacterium RBG_16_59_8]